MSPELFARTLNGREYGSEITSDEEATAKAAGLVVVFGASDDLVELRGAIDEELGACDGTTFRVCGDGILNSWPDSGNRDLQFSEDEAEDYFKRKAAGFKTIEAVWSPAGEEKSWAYKTDIPHAKFDIVEGDEVYCTGIVFALKDVVQA
jgi:hypothetical protein